MAHLLIDLAKIGLIVLASAIFVSALFGSGYPAGPDEFGPYPIDHDDETGE